MNAVNLNNVRRRYNSISNIWPVSDVWHYETRKGLDKALKHFNKKCLLPTRGKMLDVGSGGENYFPDWECRYQIDIAENLLKGHSNAICASIENIPFNDSEFDFVICVGSVLNYNNLLDSVLEISRVTRKGGILVFDIETTNSAEYLFTGIYKKDIAFVKSEYQGDEEGIWVYSLNNVFETLDAAGLKALDSVSIHILSVLTYRFIGNASYKLRRLDSIMNFIPFIRNFGTNFVICCQKI